MKIYKIWVFLFVKNSVALFANELKNLKRVDIIIMLINKNNIWS